MALLETDFLQSGAYSAKEFRYAVHPNLQEGVIGATDYDVTAHGTPDMAVNVAAGQGYVQGDGVVRQGLYQIVNDANVNVSIAANASGNPRIDQIALRAYDSTEGMGSDTPTLGVLQGTPTSGATLANRSGAAADPGTSLLLADVLVANGAASIVNADIRDRRPWARGAFKYILRQSGSATYTTTSTTPVDIDASNLAARIECSGKPMRVTIAAHYANSAGTWNSVAAAVDGVIPDGATYQWVDTTVTGGGLPLYAQMTFTPAAGSHVIAARWWVASGTATMYIGTAFSTQMVIEEILSPSASND